MTKTMEQVCYKVCALAQHAGIFMLEHFEKVGQDQIVEKSAHSLVSYVDVETEKMLIIGLKDLLPDAVFLTEEGTVDQSESGAGYRWIIDPLDGTTNFLKHIPVFCISIALQRGKDILLGVIYDPNRSELFYAWKGGGAWLNGKQLGVRKDIQFTHAVIATGFPYKRSFHIVFLAQLLQEILMRAQGVRRMGSAALDMAYVAAGRFDAYYETTINPWDIAAGVCLIQEAGGKVIDFDGEENYLQTGEIICGHEPLNTKILEAISEVRSKLVD